MPSRAVYRSPRTLATASVVLLGLNGAVALGGAALALLEMGSDAPSEQAATLLDVLAAAVMVLVLGTAAVYLPWLYRVRVNAEVIYPHGHQHARGWAVGGWLVPLVQFWFPWRITTDVWKASAPAGEHGVPRPVSAWPVHCWWAAILLSRLVSVMGTDSLDSEAARTYLDSYREALLTLAVSSLLTLTAAVLAILVVHRLTAMQEEHAARAWAAWTPPPVTV
ncbi:MULTISPECIES: DUF4328 domain-containing protein [Kitasatospora]|uniref:DUF4328 domain-containing protein n=1 Tax=Kitasatospora setae (strain ATCC 33774 / DSM 43861 / JCM 3304 / KCC A-0304 / NBRC 14216 / KM-6054) TaxID=452652 RepID=E4NE97_KITSK|nr:MULTISPECIES: DUF4328 domain-containing protein [Kitasatospora]BAJ29528.1 hypothetical protein KSE_37270 [Kitasatospora setae KM-6054]